MHYYLVHWFLKVVIMCCLTGVHNLLAVTIGSNRYKI